MQQTTSKTTSNEVINLALIQACKRAKAALELSLYPGCAHYLDEVIESAEKNLNKTLDNYTM